MKMIRNVASLALIAGVVGSAMAPGASAFAAENTNTHETPVSYSSTTSIPEPGDPAGATYVVNVPTAIVFTDNNKVIDASVEMLNPDGTAYNQDKTAVVTVASKNGFQLENEKDADAKVPYLLEYNHETMSKDKTSVGALNKDNQKVQGSATLKGSATKTGNYADVLTYTVTTAAQN